MTGLHSARFFYICHDPLFSTGIYDLLISRVQFEDEGEYACQASVLTNTSSGHPTRQLTNVKVPEGKADPHTDGRSTAFPMSLIKSETAHVAVIGKFKVQIVLL